jgi:Ni,Fe-hydrogenase III small subunit
MKPQINAVISIGECNTSDLIMDEEVRAWQREEERVCLMSRRQGCGRVGRRVIA